MEIQRLASVHALADQLKRLERKQDFWLSCREGVSPDGIHSTVKSEKIEKQEAATVFDTCYVAASLDIKADADKLLDDYSLGLRKKKVSSKNVPGCVYIMLQSQNMKASPDIDPSLSSEERPAFIFREVAEPLALSRFGKGMKAHPKAFLLLSYPGQSIDDCKKSVVCHPEAHHFSRCLLADVSDCTGWLGMLTDEHGLGSLVRLPARVVEKRKGCLALLLPKAAAMLRPAQEPSQGRGAASAGRHELQAPSVMRKESLALALSLELASTQSDQHLRKVVKEVQERLEALASRPGTKAKSAKISLSNQRSTLKSHRRQSRRMPKERPSFNQRFWRNNKVHFSRVGFPGNHIDR
eukprot:CAMPEP_0197623836 /NCGR_PEP_ID=MMETSP1338-20131121/3746_1 /TAXON_ID=43686 ORGANISM="Pelagodinium beii, Strain RCC1491" /NCGR_SAMPLE_ID=MMETSP1338 /ASSEMBLY_ACC=CAM_ASM_000754 /LENGTH=352 /DNA_ID=CAMNT_0043193919 /DNA_START=43 /DNA_END=1101 /DNA_ORIENTATION=+